MVSKKLVIVFLKLIFYLNFKKVFGIFNTSWINDLRNYTEKINETRQVILITTNYIDATKNHHPSMAKLLIEIMSVYPTLRISADFFNKTDKQSHSIDIWKDPTATLFIFIDNDLHYSETYRWKRVIDMMKELSFHKKCVKYLLVRLPTDSNENYDDLLQYVWTRLIVDFTVLKIPKYEQQNHKNILKNKNNELILKLYHYNPFLNSTVVENYSPGIHWFPDVMRNMHGYSVNIAVFHKPPFSYVRWNDQGKADKISGADSTLILAIAQAMNFTPNILPKLSTFEEIKEDHSVMGLLKFMESGKVDITAYLSPHYTEDIHEDTVRSDWIVIDDFCAVVPVMYKIQSPISWEAINAFILSISIVMVFWLFALFLRFNRSYWTSFTIVRILFGIPVRSNNSSPDSQRLLFNCLAIVSLFFSSNIYASLTRININNNTEIEYKNFDELASSNLIPVLSPFLYQKTFNDKYKSNSLQKLKYKSLNMTSIWDCTFYAEKYKNITCLMGKYEGNIFVKSKLNQDGKRSLKFSETCFWSDNYAFLMRKGSPLRRSFSSIIAKLTETGLKGKWYKDNYDDETMEINNDPETTEKKLETPGSVLKLQLMGIIASGFLFSTTAFIMECLYYHLINKRKKNKVNLLNLSDEFFKCNLFMLYIFFYFCFVVADAKIKNHQTKSCFTCKKNRYFTRDVKWAFVIGNI